MKDCPISKLIITETRHRSTQYRKVIDTLPILFADKNYRGLNDVIRNKINLVEADFTPQYPNTDQWSVTHHVEIITINPNDTPDATTGVHPPTVTMAWKIYVFNVNLQKELLSEFEWNSKI